MNVKPWRDQLCPRCGGECPEHVTLREITVPFEIFAMPDRRHEMYATHFYMCLALNEPVLVGPVRRKLNVWQLLLALAPQATLAKLGGALFEQGLMVDMLETVARTPSEDSKNG